MQITADRLLDTITLLIHENDQRTQAAANDILSIYRQQETPADGSDSDLMEFYVKVIQELISSGATKNNRDVLSGILLKFRSDKSFSQHKSLFELLSEMFLAPCETDDQIAQAAQTLDSVMRRIQSSLLMFKADQRVRKMAGTFRRAKEIQDPDIQIAELESIELQSQSLTDLFKENRTDSSAADLLDVIDMKDPESVGRGIQKQLNKTNLGRIKTPFQGLNLALGPTGGILRGESVIFNALPHNYKSGILLDIATGAVIYNNYTVTPGKKPLVLYITLENEAYENLMLIYKQRYRQETQKDPNLLSEEEIKQWISGFFQQFDTDFKVERHLPHNFGFDEFVGRINYWDSQGYEVIAVVVDYIHNMKKTSGNATNAARDVAVRELYNKMRNYTSNAGISLISAHPLNRSARTLASVTQNVVKKFGIEHLADSIDPEREVDVSIYMHIEKNVQGRVFLTFNLTKHRYANDTPDSHKYWAQPFPIVGVGLHDDIGQAPLYTRDIYAYGFDNEPDDFGSLAPTEANSMAVLEEGVF